MNKFILIFLLFSQFLHSKIELFSLREKDTTPIIKPEIVEESPIYSEKNKEKKEEKTKKITKPKESIKKIQQEKVKEKKKKTQPTTTIKEGPKPFEEFEKQELEKEERPLGIELEKEERPLGIELEKEERPLGIIFGLAITSFCGIILLVLIFTHLSKKERRVYRPFHLPPSDVEEELKNLKQSSKIVSSQVKEIERMVPREFIESLKSGKIFSQIAKDVLSSLEPKIKELGLAYQAIKKSLIQLDSEIQELSSLKGLNFKDLARQTSTEFIIPLKNEFEKAKFSYENMLSSFEQRQNGRLSTLEKKHLEVKEGVDEVHKRLVGLESIITSFTMFDQEPIIRTKKRKNIAAPSQNAREELNKLIYELADKGLSVDDIAKKTKIGKGEIDLILSFRKKREV